MCKKRTGLLILEIKGGLIPNLQYPDWSWDFLRIPSACPGSPNVNIAFWRTSSRGNQMNTNVFALCSPRPGNACLPMEMELDFIGISKSRSVYIEETNVCRIRFQKCGNQKTNSSGLLKTALWECMFHQRNGAESYRIQWIPLRSHWGNTRFQNAIPNVPKPHEYK